MIGVTLLAAFTTGVSSLEATTVRQLRAQFPVEYVVTPLFEAVPPPVVSALAADRRLDVVALHRVAARRLDGDTVTVTGASAGYLDAAARGALTEPVTAGSLDRLEAGTVAVSAVLAAERGLAPGGTLRLAPPTVERPVSLTVVAVLGGDGRSLLLSLDDHRRLVPGADERILVSAADGVSAAAGREAVTAATAGYAEVRVADFASYLERLTSEVDQLVAMVGGLLGLAILIALLGIATTLGLSVVERARESALLRALGLTRGSSEECSRSRRPSPPCSAPCSAPCSGWCSRGSRWARSPSRAGSGTGRCSASRGPNSAPESPPRPWSACSLRSSPAGRRHGSRSPRP
jgi:putative ABC transport system permease protein